VWIRQLLLSLLADEPFTAKTRTKRRKNGSRSNCVAEDICLWSPPNEAPSKHTNLLPVRLSHRAVSGDRLTIILLVIAVPDVTPIPSLGPAIQRLSQSLTALTVSHADNSASMRKLAEEREQLDVREAELRGMVAKAEAKRSWFVAFREYVESVATFLDEKVRHPSPTIRQPLTCSCSSLCLRDWKTSTSLSSPNGGI
jgi:hypothetical protein